MEKRKLTRKQELFIEYYLANGFNGTKAAIDAGYSEHTAHSIANENLKKPEIKAEIERLNKERVSGVILSKETLLKHLNDIMVSNMTDPKGVYASLKAIEIINKMNGNNAPEKTQISTDPQSPPEIKINIVKPKENDNTDI